MSAVEGALQWFWAFVDRCKSGNNAELRLCFENGQLKANMCAALGPVRVSSDFSKGCLQKASPSQLRRRMRRAAERSAKCEAAAGKVVACAYGEEAAGAEEVPAIKAAAEKVSAAIFADDAAGKTAAEEAAAVKAAAADKCVEKAASKQVLAKTVDEAEVVEKAETTTLTAKSVEVLKTATPEKVAPCAIKAGVDCETVATTSSVASKPVCWNCNVEMTVSHQCDSAVLDTPVSSSTIGPPVPCLDSVPKTDSDTTSTAPPLPRRRGLNINTFCVKCEKRHPVWQKCQCQSPT